MSTMRLWVIASGWWIQTSEARISLVLPLIWLGIHLLMLHHLHIHLLLSLHVRSHHLLTLPLWIESLRHVHLRMHHLLLWIWLALKLLILSILHSLHWMTSLRCILILNLALKVIWLRCIHIWWGECLLLLYWHRPYVWRQTRWILIDLVHRCALRIAQSFHARTNIQTLWIMLLNGWLNGWILVSITLDRLILIILIGCSLVLICILIIVFIQLAYSRNLSNVLFEKLVEFWRNTYSIFNRAWYWLIFFEFLRITLRIWISCILWFRSFFIFLLRFLSFKCIIDLVCFFNKALVFAFLKNICILWNLCRFIHHFIQLRSCEFSFWLFVFLIWCLKGHFCLCILVFLLISIWMKMLLIIFFLLRIQNLAIFLKIKQTRIFQGRGGNALFLRTNELHLNIILRR